MKSFIYRLILICIVFSFFYTCSSSQEKAAVDQRISSADTVAKDPTVPQAVKTKVYREVAVQNGEDAIKAGKERDSYKATLESNQWKISLVNYVIGAIILVVIGLLIAAGIKIYLTFKPLP